MTTRPRRLVHVGNVIVDIVMQVPSLPTAGGDVLSSKSQITPGGGFNVMTAARRQGLTTAYGGAHGIGNFGDMIRHALAAAHIDILQPPTVGMDSGFCVALVDQSGERTFATNVGAEATLSFEALSGLDVTPGDVIYLSGYSLLSPLNGPALVRWLAELPDAICLIVDPQPLVADIPESVLRPVLNRADWWTCNLPEATRLTASEDPDEASRDLMERTGRAGVLLRLGAAGCLLIERGQAAVRIPAFPVKVVDTNGAGDAHVGSFLAALALGMTPFQAVHRANASASLAITQLGPATAPSTTELEAFLADPTAGIIQSDVP